MKTTFLIHRLLPVIACLLFAMAAISCQTTTPPTAAVQQPVTRKNWVKVSSQPPTYYPRGTPSDCPTDFRSGEWVVTGDNEGTRYFIPLHANGGIPRAMLLEEALAARKTDVYRSTTAEQCGEFAKTVGTIVVAPPLFMMALAGSQYGPPLEECPIDKKTFFPFDP
jgi:hypothetical protein